MILTTGGIDDLCLKYFVEAGAMAVRRCKKQDLKRIAKATGGKCSGIRGPLVLMVQGFVRADGLVRKYVRC